ncbi:MAG TPA: hypothetical protein ENJ08_02170 [Gammaproteobacteria bacterium]|nr:hypothetical protein [Gammaproteobacteria bacterium]
MKYLNFILILLSGCSNSLVTVETGSSCSCSDYLSKREKPDWVGVDRNESNWYLSNGVSGCTGIQSIDFEEADLSARTNLSRILNSDIKSQITLIQESSSDGSSSKYGNIITQETTSSLLNNSLIYERWLDNDSCTIYSAVKISHADVNLALEKLTSRESNKLINHRFTIRAKGKYHDRLILIIQNLLINAGVKTISTLERENTYMLEGSIVDIDFYNKNRVAKVTIQLSIIAPDKNVIWSHQEQGKSVSFGGISTKQLLNKAINQAARNSSTALITILNTNIN